MKKKILFIVPSLAVGGSQRVMLTLLENMNRNLFSVSLIVVTQKGELYDQVPGDIKVVHLGCKRMRAAFNPLYQSIHKIKPDIVFSTLGYLNFTLILLKFFMASSFKLVVRESNTVSVQIKGFTHKCLWWLLYRFLYKKADKIICQSDYMLDDLIHKFNIPKEKVSRIYNPVDTLKVRKMADIDLSPFLDFGRGPHIIGVGRLVNQKGYEHILNFIPKILGKFPDVHFWILGTGELELTLKKLINELDISEHVTLVGHQKNPYTWMKHADLFILSSLFEGLPNVLLEAITNKCAVLCLEHPGGTKEILELFGCSNRFVCNFSLDGFFDKDAKYSEEILNKYFSVDGVTRKYEQEFLGLLS
jgi:glycosyltransferase involved in cell wall biosynthesis